jgi:hypothetical protein
MTYVKAENPMDRKLLNLDYLKTFIIAASNGDEVAIGKLRRICKRAAESAPVRDLVTLASCLHQIGIEATRDKISMN